MIEVNSIKKDPMIKLMIQNYVNWNEWDHYGFIFH